jgi:hypothetical protein
VLSHNSATQASSPYVIYANTQQNIVLPSFGLNRLFLPPSIWPLLSFLFEMMPTSTPAVGKDTASLSSSSTNQRKSTHSGEHPKDYHLDTAVFKELAKRTLIEALNEASPS